MNISIQIHDQQIQSALQRLMHAGQNMGPVMLAIGDDVVERTKQRFATSSAPDGNRWAPNSQVTYLLSMRDWGKGNFTKGGRVNAKGAARLGAKRPLIGETGDLSRQFHVAADSSSVTIGSSMVYARIHQFGGKTASNSMIPGKRIPARPFLPITPDGDLYPQEQSTILAWIEKAIAEAIR